MISHFYDVTGGLSLSAVGGRATTNTDGLRQSVRSKHGHPLETPGHPIMIRCTYTADTSVIADFYV